jgi:DNA-binding NtrC family response regulator
LDNWILIVDDEEMIRSILVRRLSKEGYSCLTASSGREALHYFHKDNLSLIISDIKMPDMNGVELLRNVKAMSPKMVVIIVTAYPEIDMAVMALRLGAYDFITKPVDLELVVLSLKKALEKKRLEEETEAYHRHLEKLVGERTAKLQEAYRVLKKAHLDSVKVLTEAIDAKDSCTRGHSERVRKMVSILRPLNDSYVYQILPWP